MLSSWGGVRALAGHQHRLLFPLLPFRSSRRQFSFLAAPGLCNGVCRTAVLSRPSTAPRAVPRAVPWVVPAVPRVPALLALRPRGTLVRQPGSQGLLRRLHVRQATAQDGQAARSGHQAPEASTPAAGGTWPLLGAALTVYTLAGFLQERVSRSPDFNGPFLVLCETGSYVIGGLLWAFLERGKEGIKNCIRPSRYLVFLPASLAFFAINFFQYPSLRVFGAVNHGVLAQLNLAVMAGLLYAWKGQRFLPVQIAALLHLCLGLLLLVSSTPAPGAKTPEDLTTGLMAVTACIAGSAFASVYLESVLKAGAGEAIFVQMHQMNLVQAIAAFGMLLQGWAAQPGSSLPVTISLQTGCFLALAVARGALIALTLKRVGSLANGLVGVGSLVCVGALQYFVDGREPVGVALQGTIMMSVVNYLVAERQAKAAAVRAGAAKAAGAVARMDPWVPAVVQALLLVSLLGFLPEGTLSGWFPSKF